MSKEWQVLTSDEVLEYISAEYSNLDKISAGLGVTFFEEFEEIFSRIKQNPLQFPRKNNVYRRAILSVSRRIKYSVYFRVSENEIRIDLILSNSINPRKHPD